MSPIDGVKKQQGTATRPPVAKKPADIVADPAALADAAKKVFDGYHKVRPVPKDMRAGAQSLKTDGFTKATKAAYQKVITKGMDPKDTLNKVGVLKKVSGAAGTVTNAVKLPGQIATASKDVRDAVRSGSAQSRDKAIGSVATAGKTALSTVKGGLELTRDVQKYGGAYRAASKSFRAVAPNASPQVVRAVSRSAAKSAFQGVTSGAMKSGIQTSMRNVTNASTIARTMGAPVRSAGKVLMREAGEAAGKSALKAGLKAGGGTVAKMAGRFAPGVNIAIAAMDTANAYSTVRDPNASTGKKVTSVITAIGSVASATNIPVVSQVGAVVSTVSSIAGIFF